MSATTTLESPSDLDDVGPPPGWWANQKHAAPLGIRSNGTVAFTMNVMYKSGAAPKYHFDVHCRGLERARWKTQQTKSFPSVTAMFERATGRPCRACALEPALARYLRSPHTRTRRTRATVPGRLAVVTFSSQGSPHDTNNPSRFQYRDVTPSGAERLERVAAALSWPVTDTPAGPVTWALLTTQAAAAVAKNLRTLVAPDGVPFPDRDTVQAVWALAVTAPPELDGWGPELWDLASSVVA